MNRIQCTESITDLAQHIRAHPDDWKCEDREGSNTVLYSNFRIYYNEYWFGYANMCLEFSDQIGRQRIILSRSAFKPIIASIRFMKDWQAHKESREAHARLLVSTRELKIKSELNIT